MDEAQTPRTANRRLRSQSLDVVTQSPLLRITRSPVTPASGGAGSDVESTDAEISPPTVTGNLRSRSQSGDTPNSIRTWKSLGSVRHLFKNKARSNSCPMIAEFFLWNVLPEAVRYAVVSFLSMPDVLNIALVSRDAYTFSRSDVIWRPLFFTRFTGTPGVPVTLAHEDFFNEYCERLVDPRPGDGVEVAWEGTFNLLCHEAVTTYEGRAWWSAVIVEATEDLYKIHYPQWDATVWDEWVPRSRVRWPAKPGSDKTPIFKGDYVEYHCSSSHGISPWLEAVVSDTMSDGRFRLADVIRSDPRRPVPRDALRLIERGRGHLFRRLRLPALTSEGRCTIM